MRNPYVKEGVGTVVFFLLYILMGHTGLWLAPLTKSLDYTVMGLPLHYFGAIVLGWLGLIVVSLFYVKWADRIDVEIASYIENESTQVDSSIDPKTFDVTSTKTMGD